MKHTLRNYPSLSNRMMTIVNTRTRQYHMWLRQENECQTITKKEISARLEQGILRATQIRQRITKTKRKYSKLKGDHLK